MSLHRSLTMCVVQSAASRCPLNKCEGGVGDRENAKATRKARQREVTLTEMIPA